MNNPRVLLVHGLLLSPLSMLPLGMRLRQAGWKTSYFAFSSLFEPADHIIKRLARELSVGPTYVVGHSLGGLLSVQTLVRHTNLRVERIVCLGTPLRGSSAAAGILPVPVLGRCMGQSKQTLLDGLGSDLPSGVEVGMIAGSSPLGLGGFFTPTVQPNDGTVFVQETQFPGLAAHCIVDSSHTGMLINPSVSARVARFLNSGSFTK